MRVLHVISRLVKADGHSLFCMALAERLSDHGSEQMIFALPSSGGVALADPKGLVQYADGSLLRLLNVSLPVWLERQITALALFFKPDVVHLHGGWHPVLFFGACVAKRMGVPVVLSLHGSLRPVVKEGDRRLRKRVAWWLYQRRLVEMADVIHASTETEAGDIARLGFDKRVVVIPSGVDVKEGLRRGCSEGLTLGEAETADHATRTNSAFSLQPSAFSVGAARTRTVLYMGRLHPLKGLDLLVDAWAEIKGSIAPMMRVEGASRISSVETKVTNAALSWQLVIVGPDEQGTLKALKEQVKRLRLERSVTFAGPLYGEEKMRTLQRADLFVLPTRSDNFGIAVAEALACGVPVITTKGAPWAEVENCGNALMRECVNEGEENQAIRQSGNKVISPVRAGWWVEIGVEPLAEALREAMRLTDEERYALGGNGRRLVVEKYAWPKIAKEMCYMYEWIFRQHSSRNRN